MGDAGHQTQLQVGNLREATVGNASQDGSAVRLWLACLMMKEDAGHETQLQVSDLEGRHRSKGHLGKGRSGRCNGLDDASLSDDVGDAGQKAQLQVDDL